MGIFDIFRKQKKEDLPLIARVNIAELMKQREEELTSTYGQLYNELPDTASQLPNASN